MKHPAPHAKRNPAPVKRLSLPRYIKAWGFEDWIHNGPDYTFKILQFYPRSAGSLHYHLKKTETWYVVSGRFKIVLVNRKTGQSTEHKATHGWSFHLPAGTCHQIFCLEAGRIFEASTPHDEADTCRISPSQAPRPAITCSLARKFTFGRYRHAPKTNLPTALQLPKGFRKAWKQGQTSSPLLQGRHCDPRKPKPPTAK